MNKLEPHLHKVNLFIPSYKTVKKPLDNYNKEIAELKNNLQAIRVAMHLSIKMLVEKGVDLK